MHITNDIKPVTYLKAKAADLLDQINDTHRPMIITQNGEPRAVLQDPKSYEEMQNALGLLKILAIGEDNIRKGNLRSQETVFQRSWKPAEKAIMNSSYDIFRAASAEYDLKEVIDFIAWENPENASKIVTEICKKASELKNYPERGRIVPELQSQGIFLYRELLISPWRIIYRIKDTQFNVLSVHDSRQNVEDILLERLIKSS